MGAKSPVQHTPSTINRTGEYMANISAVGGELADVLAVAEKKIEKKIHDGQLPTKRAGNQTLNSSRQVKRKIANSSEVDVEKFQRVMQELHHKHVNLSANGSSPSGYLT